MPLSDQDKAIFRAVHVNAAIAAPWGEVHEMLKKDPDYSGEGEDLVATIITEPAWRAYARVRGIPPHGRPPEYGVGESETFVIESDRFAAVSFPLSMLERLMSNAKDSRK